MPERPPRGVSFHRETGLWRAYLRLPGRFLSLGLYNTAEAAAAARDYVA